MDGGTLMAWWRGSGFSRSSLVETTESALNVKLMSWEDKPVRDFEKICTRKICREMFSRKKNRKSGCLMRPGRFDMQRFLEFSRFFFPSKRFHDIFKNIDIRVHFKTNDHYTSDIFFSKSQHYFKNT